jgi:outer membrane protein assembly factor BamB
MIHMLATLMLPRPIVQRRQRRAGAAISRGMFSRALLFTLGVASITVDAPAQAPMFRGDLRHTGVFAGPAPRELNVKWKMSTGAYVISSPVIDGNALYAGGTDGRLYAVNRADGRTLWTFQTGARITSTPAVANGTVYVLSYDDTLYAVDASTGKARWRFATMGEHRYTATHLHGTLPAHEAMPDPYDTYLSSPAVWDGKVSFGSSDSYVYAVDARTGARLWRYKTGDVVHSSPAIADGTLYVGGWDTFFYALDAKTGSLRWKLKTGDDPDTHNQIGVQSSPAVVDGVVYFGCRDSHLYAVDARSGAVRWKKRNRGAWVISSPAVANGRVYYATADGASFIELNAATGDSLFASKGGWYYFASPAIVGTMAYIGNWDGRFYAFDMATHRQAAIFETDASRENRAKYLRPDGSMAFGKALPNGREYFYDLHVVALFNAWTMGGFLSSAAVADGTVYVASMDGNLYALGDGR